MADSVAEEYRSSLSELSFNSKPHINMLTMIAEENIKFAPTVVQTIVEHINSVSIDMMLPCLYLVDSIVKNVGKIYVQLFSKHLIALFTSVFEKVDENVRVLLYKLRSTWTGIFPNTLMLRLDTSVACLDPAWPILAQPSHKNIHVNPKFLDNPTPQVPKKEETVVPAPQKNTLLQEANEIKKKQLEVLKVLHAKKQQLIELKRKAASSTTAPEYLGSDVQKVLNARDPRLSKKVSDDDSSTLQSVVVVPKKSEADIGENDLVADNFKEKDFYISEAKKLNTDTDSESGLKKDFRNKLNNKNNQNLVEQSYEDDKRIRNNNKNRKRTFSPTRSVVSPSKLVNKVSITESNDAILNKNNAIANISVKSIKNKEYFKKFPHNIKVEPKREDQYDLLNENEEEPPFKKRLETSSTPLIFGNQDKDYRTLLPQKTKSDERILGDLSCSKHVPVVKSFKLDNKNRKVYFMNNRSFVVMDDNVPRELNFEGPPKLIFVEGLNKPFELCFGGHEVKFEIDGKWNSIRFGTPACEVYVNNYPYEATFGGPPLPVVLEDGQIHRIRISGPPPQVILSQAPAYELYDRFCESNQEFLRRYDNQHNDIPAASRDVDMRINNTKISSCFNFPVEKVNDVDWLRMPLGGSQQAVWNAPMNSFESFRVENPSFVTQRNYNNQPDWNRPDLNNHNPNIPPTLPPKQLQNRLPIIPSTTTYVKNYNDMSLQSFPTSKCTNSVSSSSLPFSQPNYNNTPEFALNSQLSKTQFSNTPRLTPPPLPPFLGTTCMSAPFVNTVVTAPVPMTGLTSTMQTTSLTSLSSVSTLSNPVQIGGLSNSMPTTGLKHPAQLTVSNPILSNNSTTVPPASAAPPVNMDIFFEKLVAAGIIGKKSETPPPTSNSTESEKVEEDKKEEVVQEEPIPDIVFEPKCLKEYYPGVINILHNGSQCATCGMRFKEIQSEQYSRHLDWHFRMNRREKDGAKKPFSRRLFYEIKDWIEFKEFEEVDERAPSYFELQASGEQNDENLPEIVCSVPSTDCESEICEVCSEQFQLFWVEEEEEWHLRNAVKHDGKVYHPACYEDFRKANEVNNADAETSMEESVTKIEGEKDGEQANKASDIIENDNIEIICSKEEKPELVEKVPSIILEPKEETSIKEENNAISNDVKSDVDAEDGIKSEVKMEIDIKIENDSEVVDEQTKVEKVVEVEPVKSEDVGIDPSPNENVSVRIEVEDEDDEFHPPTPDPRFEVLPAVSKGTELSALCTIM